MAGESNHRSLTADEVFDKLTQEAQASVPQYHGSVQDKLDALERFGNATLKLVASMRGGDHDAKIARSASEAAEAADGAAEAILALIDAINAAKIQRKHPGTAGVPALEALYDQAQTLSNNLAKYSLYFEKLVPGFVERVADLDKTQSEEESNDLPF